MTQNILNHYPAIVSKLGHHYGWDNPSEQCQWQLNALTKNGLTPWQAFSYLVETCMKQNDDRELDYLWFEALKNKNSESKAA